MSIDFVILAAGLGTRMKCSTPKIFQTVAGKPIVRYVVDACKSFEQNVFVVTQEHLREDNCFVDVTPVVQRSPKGTADAVRQAVGFLKSEYTVILCGDMPLLENRHLDALVNATQDNTLTAMIVPDELSHMPYGRVILQDGQFDHIIEYKNATPEERSSKLANAGVYKVKTELLKRYIGEIRENPVSKEFYLTDLFGILKDTGNEVAVVQSDDYWSFHGINTMQDLAKAERVMQTRLREKFMNAGVKLLDPETTYFAHDTEIASDVIIEPNVIIGAEVRIGRGSRINAFSHLVNCEVSENVEIGPFARIRGGAKFMSKSSIGNFVEVKGSTLGCGSKAKHLAYIGDTTIGNSSNIGAGTITCNYDGVKKHKTSIGDYVFVGSNSTLIAPVSVGDGAIIGAGSVITKGVSPNSLAIARTSQTEIPDIAEKIWRDKGRRK
ncbi:MAG: bifunctional UDP-N-acetylglucosamine diphosphorylase/glucosamine-1-phosphate N-acetyltransferase GlmU [Alphaproteobacteria bacterium]|nr:bifunctional UDP-N-acetylglucosamine diphosphorylase/glucosamine-1-phosphate N-acetyltransferase GlmU [Alphaproteobacteria bacterium]